MQLFRDQTRLSTEWESECTRSTEPQLQHAIATTRIRYKDQGTLSTLHPSGGDNLHVEFLANVTGVAPGQSAVFFEGDDIVGGGIIQRSSWPAPQN